MVKVIKEPKHRRNIDELEDELEEEDQSSIFCDVTKTDPDFLKRVSWAPLYGTTYTKEFYGKKFDPEEEHDLVAVLSLPYNRELNTIREEYTDDNGRKRMKTNKVYDSRLILHNNMTDDISYTYHEFCKKLYDYHTDPESTEPTKKKMRIIIMTQKVSYGTSYSAFEINNYIPSEHEGMHFNLDKARTVSGKPITGYVYTLFEGNYRTMQFTNAKSFNRNPSQGDTVVRLINIIKRDDAHSRYANDYRDIYHVYSSSGVQYALEADPDKFSLADLRGDNDQTETYGVCYRDHSMNRDLSDVLFYRDQYCLRSDYHQLVDLINEDISNFKRRITFESFDPDEYYYQKVIEPLEQAHEMGRQGVLLYDVVHNQDVDEEEDGEVMDRQNGQAVGQAVGLAAGAILPGVNNRNLTEEEFMERALQAIADAEAAEAAKADAAEAAKADAAEAAKADAENNQNQDSSVEEADVEEELDSVFSPESDKIMKEIYVYTEMLCGIISKMSKHKPEKVKTNMVKHYTELFSTNQVRDHIEARCLDNKSLADKINEMIRTRSAVRMDDFEEDVAKHIHRGSGFGDTYVTMIDNSKGTSDVLVVNAVQPDAEIYHGFRTYKKAGFYSGSAGPVNNPGKTIPIIPLSRRMSARGLQWLRIIYGQVYGTLTDDTVKALYFMDLLRLHVSAHQSMKSAEENGDTQKQNEMKTIFNMTRTTIRASDFTETLRYYPSKRAHMDRFEMELQRYWRRSNGFKSHDKRLDSILSILGNDKHNKCIVSGHTSMVKIFEDAFSEAGTLSKRAEPFFKKYDQIRTNPGTWDLFIHNVLRFFTLVLRPNKCELAREEKSALYGELDEVIRRVNIHHFTQGFEAREPEYYCYYTMESTEDTGGYTFYPHKSRHNEYCYPSYVVSPEVYDMWNKNKQNHSVKCPVCCSILNVSRLIKVSPRDEDSESEDSVSVDETEEIERKVKTINIDVKSFHPQNSFSLKKMTRLRFDFERSEKARFTNHLIFGHSSSDIYVNPDGKEATTEFKSRVPKFLHKISFDNIVVAGGMCRSILLRQPIQDIDIFFVGLDEDRVRNRVFTLINDVIRSNLKIDPKMRFILMYKPLYSVVELLCVKRKIEVESEVEVESEFEIENADKLEADEESELGRDDSKKQFCDHNIIHKVQIILRAQETIKDVFNNFDMYPSCVAYNGKKVLFNQHSYHAYKYMVNLVDPIKCRHNRYNYRALKYYKYGFAIGIERDLIPDQILRKLERVPKSYKIDRCKFETKYRGKPLDEIGFIPVSEFKILKRDEETNQDLTGEEIVYAEPLYKSYDVDNNVEDLYNYISEEGIKYCFLNGPIEDTNDVAEVMSPESIKFLVSTRDVTYNWYDPTRQEIRT